MTAARLYTHQGQTNTLKGWADKIGVTREALNQRLLHGWTLAEAVTSKRHGRTPKRFRRDAPQATSFTPINHPQLELLTSNHLKQRRAVNRTLRQFCRDLEAIMSRGVDRDILKTCSDRSIPVARDLLEIGNS